MIFASAELSWRVGDNALTLHLGRSQKPLLSVIPDAVYPHVWRVCHRGRLSDIANLTRAKDAGLTRALNELNRSDETPLAALPMRQSGQAEMISIPVAGIGSSP